MAGIHDPQIGEDNSVDRRLTLPPVKREKINREGIADKRSPPEINTAVMRQKTTFDGIESQVDRQLLRMPRLTVPQFATQLYRERQLNFREFLTAADGGGKTPGRPSAADGDHGSRAALNRLQVTTTTGIFQFQRNIALPYMRKSLSLSYEHVALTKSLVALTGSMAQMLESKLEAIKLNTSAPDERKQSTAYRLMNEFGKVGLKQVIKHGLPFAKKNVAIPLLERYHQYRAGTTTAADLADEIRSTFKDKSNTVASFLDNQLRKTKTGEKISDTASQLRDKAVTQWNNKYSDRDFLTPAVNRALKIADKAFETANKYNFLKEATVPTRPTAAFMHAAVSSPPNAGTESPSSVDGSGVYPTQQDANEKLFDYSNLKVPSGESAFIKGQSTIITISERMAQRLDDIYALLVRQFHTDEKIASERLNIAEKAEHLAQGPRVGSYAAHEEHIAARNKEREEKKLAALGKGGGTASKRRGRIAGALGSASAAGLGWLGGLFKHGIGKLANKGIGALFTRLFKKGGEEVVEKTAVKEGEALAEDAVEHEAAGGGLTTLLSLGGKLGKFGLGSVAAPALKMLGKAGSKGLGLLAEDGEPLWKTAAKLGLFSTIGGGLPQGVVLHGLWKNRKGLLGGAKRLFGKGSKTAANDVGKDATEAVGKDVGKDATETIGKDVAETGAEDLAKQGGKFGLEEGAKLGAEEGAKFFGKKIPIFGALLGTGLAIHDLYEGNYLDAAGDFTSGVVSTIPGIGTAASAAIDAAMLAHDVSTAMDRKNKTKKKTTASWKPLPLLMKAYGFSDLKHAKVIQFYHREIWDRVDRHLPLMVDHNNFSSMATVLLNDHSAAAVDYIRQWYQKRFMPIFLTYTNTLGRMGKTIYDATSLTAQQQTIIEHAITHRVAMISANYADLVPTPQGFHQYLKKSATNDNKPNIAAPEIPTHHIVTKTETHTGTVFAGGTSITKTEQSASPFGVSLAVLKQQHIFNLSGTQQLDLITARLKAYGVVAGGRYILMTISQLEDAYYQAVVDKRSTAFEAMDAQSIVSGFGLNANDPDAVRYIKMWYDLRFSPIFSAFLTPLLQDGGQPENVASLSSTQITSLIQVINRAAAHTMRVASGYIPSNSGYQQFKTSKRTGGGATPPASRATPRGNAAASSTSSSTTTGTTTPRRISPTTSPTQVDSESITKPPGAITKASPYRYTGVAPSTNSKLGALSAHWESGAQGNAAIGWDSTGGTSYGEYQIESKPNSSGQSTFTNFLSWMKEQGGHAAKLAHDLSAAGNPNGGRNGPVAQEWRKLAPQLQKYSHDFIKKTHYDVAFKRLPKSLQEEINKYPALQQVLWSTAVQHGAYGASEIFNKVYNPKDTLETTIRKIYQERGRHFDSSTPQVREEQLVRFAQESKMAEMMAANETKSPVNDNATFVASNDNGVKTPTSATKNKKSIHLASLHSDMPSHLKNAIALNKTPPEPLDLGSSHNQIARNTAPSPMMIPTVDTITHGVVPKPSLEPIVDKTGPTESSSAKTTRDSTLPTTPTQAVTSPTPLVDHTTAQQMLKTLQTIATGITDMHTTLKNGTPMQKTNDLLQAHLDKPSSVVAPVMNVSNTKVAASGGENDLAFTKTIRRAG